MRPALMVVAPTGRQTSMNSGRRFGLCRVGRSRAAICPAPPCRFRRHPPWPQGRCSRTLIDRLHCTRSAPDRRAVPGSPRMRPRLEGSEIGRATCLWPAPRLDSPVQVRFGVTRRRPRTRHLRSQCCAAATVPRTPARPEPRLLCRRRSRGGSGGFGRFSMRYPSDRRTEAKSSPEQPASEVMPTVTVNPKPSIAPGGLDAQGAGPPSQSRTNEICEPFQNIHAHRTLAADAIARSAVEHLGDLLVGGNRRASAGGKLLDSHRIPSSPGRRA